MLKTATTKLQIASAKAYFHEIKLRGSSEPVRVTVLEVEGGLVTLSTPTGKYSLDDSQSADLLRGKYRTEERVGE